MQRNASLFGKYLRCLGRTAQKGFKKKQILAPIPVKAYGRPPSAASQCGLYHDEDYNYHTKISFSLRKHRRKLKPNVLKKDFVSEALNTTLKNVKVTTSALHAIDDAGGIDAYVCRTPPEELRSVFGEKMKAVMRFYELSPDVRRWAMPWKAFASAAAREDPCLALYRHLRGKEVHEARLRQEQRLHSPYFLPPLQSMHPIRQQFPEAAAEPQPLHLGWATDSAHATAFKRRIGMAVNQVRSHASHEAEDGYRTGNNRGGGGQSGSSLRKRSKTHKWREIRAY
ncbi:uncharacterized protein LOC34622077 [Cyclospora cayetanensis]|uniref:Uncharacterized protein LOC34622077 n=1 Tax=Cyclospora cayetanensis TaxID=88456 RepID=A0A6P6RVQ1_9EIME|nr:uncharacterized protein LOC34622077 [Cyclospora cayetanensis]